jgi:hypothetical protein
MGLYTQVGDIASESQFVEAAKEIFDFFILHNEINEARWS